MEIFLYIVFFVSCLMLVTTVLLQPGKTDAGALFTSGVSSAALNPRGTQSVLSKITIGAATIFMLSALMLSLPAITGDRSVLDTQGETTSDANSNTNANANAAANAANAAPAAPAANSNVVVPAAPVDDKAPAKEDDQKKAEPEKPAGK